MTQTGNVTNALALFWSSTSPATATFRAPGTRLGPTNKKHNKHEGAVVFDNVQAPVLTMHDASILTCSNAKPVGHQSSILSKTC